MLKVGPGFTTVACGETDALNIRKHLQTEKESAAYVRQHLDLIGSEHSFPHYPQGWAQVSNTPLKWYKKHTHGGGIRAPLIVSWPRGVAARGPAPVGNLAKEIEMPAGEKMRPLTGKDDRLRLVVRDR